MDCSAVIPLPNAHNQLYCQNDVNIAFLNSWYCMIMSFRSKSLIIQLIWNKMIFVIWDLNFCAACLYVTNILQINVVIIVNKQQCSLLVVKSDFSECHCPIGLVCLQSTCNLVNYTEINLLFLDKILDETGFFHSRFFFPYE